MLPLHVALTLLLVAKASSNPVAEPEAAKLRRIPRIYNALITSDEELLPSQAYPAIAPVLRPAHLVHYAPYAPAAAPGDVLPPIQDQDGLYAPDPHAPHAYTNLPGFNDTLLDPQGGAQPLYGLQPQNTVPQFMNHVKNNRPSNRDIPDVPPPPLPVSPPRTPDSPPAERKPQDYPPAPPQGLPFL